jgi:hypothetical protein
MYCPTCSTQAVEGAKFCKTCGMNLAVITQALSGGVVVSDPLRDREYKRARKQISDGIHGIAVGSALLIAAGLAYFLMPKNSYVYVLSLALALAGVVKLFKSIGSIIDSKVGPKMVDPALQPRGTGGLSAPQPQVNVRPSQRLSLDSSKQPPSPTRPVAPEDGVAVSGLPAAPQQADRPPTGRINREHSSPLRNLNKDDDLISKLRN